LVRDPEILKHRDHNFTEITKTSSRDKKPKRISQLSSAISVLKPLNLLLAAVGEKEGGLGSALTYPIARGRRPRSASQPTVPIMMTARNRWLNGLLDSNFSVPGL
jgi:hypothetical protein